MRYLSLHAGIQPLIIAIAFGISPTTFGNDLEAFAASLLCQEATCPPSVEPEPLSPLVIEGTTLPIDAARERDDQQAFLVRQGAYLTDLGNITSLNGDSVSIHPPERGELQARDHGPAELLPTNGPVIIATPQGKPP